MTIALVQGNARATSSTSSINVTLTQTPTNGNVLVACIALRTYGVSVSNITQQGVTWTRQCSAHNSWGDEQAEIWLGTVGLSALTSVTVSLTGTPPYGAIADVCEWSGVATTGFLDKTMWSSDSYPGTATSSTGTTATTTQASELWIGCIATANQPQSTPTNGFTLLDGAVYSATGCAYLYKVVSSTGAASSGTTLAGADAWVGCIATFIASTGGGGSDLTVTGNLTVDGTTTLQSDLDVQGNGKIYFSPGTSAPDTLLWRTNPQELSLTNAAGSSYGNLSVNDIVVNGLGKIQVQPDIKILRTNNNEISLQNLASEYANLKLNKLSVETSGISFKAPNGYTTTVQAVNGMTPDYPYVPLQIQYGLIADDILAKGFLSTTSNGLPSVGGGAILVGHGFTNIWDPPRITLADTANADNSQQGVPVDNQNPDNPGKYSFDTLYITKSNLYPDVQNQLTNAAMINNPPSLTNYITNWQLGNLAVGDIQQPFIVGSGGVTIGALVALDSIGHVVLASSNNASRVIGVAKQTQSTEGQPVNVIIWGLARVKVSSSATFNPGDRVRVSSTTAGEAEPYTLTTATGQVIGKSLTQRLYDSYNGVYYIDLIISISS